MFAQDHQGEIVREDFLGVDDVLGVAPDLVKEALRLLDIHQQGGTRCVDRHIVLQVNGTAMEVDSRPSDAIALAVRTDAPIFAHDTVIEKACVQMDEEGRPLQSEVGEDAAEPVREEELKSLSAFTDFISTLDLDDLGKGEIPPPSETGSPGETS